MTTFGQYAAILPQKYFVHTSATRDPEAPTSVLDSVRSKRYIGNNEIPTHKEFNADTIKALVEQKGTGMISRSMKKNAAQWNPMAGVVLSSIHPINISDAEREPNSGTARRLLVVTLQKVFEIQLGADVKDAILAGDFNQELFHWCRVGYQHFVRLAGMKRVYPQPPRFLLDTAAVLSGCLRTRIQTWIEDNTLAQRTYDTGSSQPAVRLALAQALQLEPRTVASMMGPAGLVEKRCGTARVYLYEYPTEGRARCVKVKPSEEWV